MKKSLLILGISLSTLSLMAFGYMKWHHTQVNHQELSCISQPYTFDYPGNNPFKILPDFDFVYKVGPRFRQTITKADLDKATSVIDLVPREATESLESYRSVKVAVVDEVNEIGEMGENELLNKAQLKLLNSTDYSNNIHIYADCLKRDPLQDKSVAWELVYYITIVPEQEAEYVYGYQALMEYLKENSQHATAIVEKNQIRPGTISFTITREGTVANTQLKTTSGYPFVDATMLELITNMPGKWIPATNSQGEKIEQELIFFFGIEGC